MTSEKRKISELEVEEDDNITTYLYEENGTALAAGRRVPSEVLYEILLRVDPETLLSCKLVCRYWCELVQAYVWRKKAELATGESLSRIQPKHWQQYYFVCCGQPFDRDLVRSKLGVRNFDNDDAVSFGDYKKCLKIDLVEAGFSGHVLDYIRPSIKISEHLRSFSALPTSYKCMICLFTGKDQLKSSFQCYKFRKLVGSSSEWNLFTAEVRDYQQGVRGITFYHAADSEISPAGCEMSDVSVRLQIDDLKVYEDDCTVLNLAVRRRA